MQSNAKRGAWAGLIAGVIFGVILQVTFLRTPAGTRITMMELVANMAGTKSLVIGWIYHLFESAVIGAIFGSVLGSRTLTIKDGFKYGPLYGLAWWILGGLILGPFFLAMSVFTPRTIAPVPPLAIQSLLGHVIFGAILGTAYVLLQRKREKAEIRPIRHEEPPEPVRKAQ